MTKTEALVMARTVLINRMYVDSRNYLEVEESLEESFDAIFAINATLAKPEQDPVARVIDNGTPEGATEWLVHDKLLNPLKVGDLLYTDLQERPWEWLSKEKKAKILQSLDWKNSPNDLINLVQSWLKSQNT